VQDTFDNFRAKANEEVAALNQELGQYRNQATTVDERVEEMTGLLANSEREIVKMHKELTELREQQATMKIQLDAALKENRTLKRKNTILEKAKDDAKGQTMAEMKKQMDDLREANKKLQAEMENKTHYMQAIEGQKGKLRKLPPPSEQGQ
jgi:chromosome segregation ATPase